MSSGSDAEIVQLPASSSTAPASSRSTSGVTVASSSTSRGNVTEPSKPKQAPYMNDKIPAYPVFNGQVVIVNDDGDFLARRPAEKTPVLPFLCVQCFVFTFRKSSSICHVVSNCESILPSNKIVSHKIGGANDAPRGVTHRCGA
jgi:hypothetical protein